MRVDRPLAGAVISLGWGLGLIIGYGKGTTGFNAAYPFDASMLHLDITTTGPGVMGGLVLVAVGTFLLLWAFVAALGTVFSSGEDREEYEDGYSVATESGYSVVPEDGYSVVPKRVWVDEPEAERATETDQRELFSRSSGRTLL
jgi:hypothetical protein